MDNQSPEMFQEVDMFVMLTLEWAKRLGGSEDEIILDIFAFALRQKPEDNRARFSGEDLRNRLHYLVDDIGIEEGFLVEALIKCIDNWLEIQSEDYAKTIHKRRSVIEALRSDPLKPGEKLEEILALAEKLEPSSIPSLEEQRRNRRKLDLWRELMAPLLELCSLEFLTSRNRRRLYRARQRLQTEQGS